MAQASSAKKAFIPNLERVEERIAASSGMGSLHHAVHAEAAKHHPAPKPAAHHTKTTTHAAAPPATSTAAAAAPATPAPAPAPPSTGSSDQAWVELVNMTGQDLEYKMSLGPYQGGKALPFDIAANTTQYRESSLISNGQRVSASFTIQFDNGPVTALNTGISAGAARGYYIFLDGNGQYYVSPFTNSAGQS